MGALARIVRQERLSAGKGPKRRFTVAKTEAIVAARARGKTRWDFTLPLLRSAILLSRHAWVSVSSTEQGGHELVDFDLGIPGSTPGSIEDDGLLLAGLDADRGASPARDDVAVWRTLIGSAVNGALADDPVAVELSTWLWDRRWERGGATGSVDPYVEHPRAASMEPGRYRLRIVRAPSSVAGTVRAWFVGRGDPFDGLAELWRARLVVGEVPDAGELPSGVMSLQAPDLPALPLGDRGRFVPRRQEPGVSLVRQGVRLLALDAELRGAGLPPGALRGWLEYDGLSLNVDQDRVVDNDELGTAKAWLLDIVRGELTESDSPRWPEEVDRVRTAADRPVDLSTLDVADGREVLYVWAPEAERVPLQMRHRVLALWPSELEAGRRRHPGARWVPMRVLGGAASAPPADVSTLTARCFEPVPVEVEPTRVEILGADGTERVVTIRPTLEAYVHQFADDGAGAVVLLAFGRRVAKISESARTMPGVTLVASLADELSADFAIGELLTNLERMRELADHVVDAAWARRDHLLETTMGRLSGHESAWHVPLVRAELEAASGQSVGLRYVRGPEGDVYLDWRSDPLLALDIGRTLDGHPCRLIDALYRLRDVGGIVIGDEHRRWHTLESSERNYTSWVIHPRGRELLDRLVPPSSQWKMPVVAEALPRPVPAAEQRHLLLGRTDVSRRLERMSSKPTDVLALQGHLLVARILGEDDLGLGGVRLFTRYDPRALTARTTVSLDTLDAEQPWPMLVPSLAAGRWLPGVALEVTPGIAALVDQWRRPALAPAPVLDRGRHATTHARPRIGPSIARVTRTPLATQTVAHPLAAGALHVDPQCEEIELWARGLRVGTFRLPSPLRGVSGRLWLTDAGVMGGHGKVLAVAIEHARMLLSRAEAGVLLSPPGSSRREGLRRFVEGVTRSVAAGHDRLGLLADPAAAPPDPTTAVLRLRGGPDLWLGPLVRHALGRPVEVDNGWFSWRAAQVVERGHPGRIELGRLDRWIRRAVAKDANGDAVLMAACLVVAEVLEQEPSWGSPARALERLLVAAETLP